MQIFNRVRLRELRIQRQISAKTFAVQIGCSAGYLSDIENGKRKPSPRLIARMVKALNVRADELYLDPDAGKDPIKARIIEILDALPESARAEALAAIARIAEGLGRISEEFRKGP